MTSEHNYLRLPSMEMCCHELKQCDSHTVLYTFCFMIVCHWHCGLELFACNVYALTDMNTPSRCKKYCVDEGSCFVSKCLIHIVTQQQSSVDPQLTAARYETNDVSPHHTGLCCSDHTVEGHKQSISVPNARLSSSRFTFTSLTGVKSLKTCFSHDEGRGLSESQGYDSGNASVEHLSCPNISYGSSCVNVS